MPRITNRKNDDVPTPGSKGRRNDKKKAKEPVKRRSRPDDDDESVDSYGNIRDLIAYSDDSDSDRSASAPASASPKAKKGQKSPKKNDEKSPRKPRAAAVAARKKIQEEEAARAAKKERTKQKEKEKRRLEEEEEADDEEEEEDEFDDEMDDDDEEEDEDEDDEEDDDEDDEDDESDEEDKPRVKASPRLGGLGGIELLISDLGEAAGPQKPKKYKLKKEPENVRRFVKLVQTEVDPTEEDIDRDITYFKGLTPNSQDRLLMKLRNKVEPLEPAVPLKFQILAKEVPSEVERVAMSKYTALQNIDPSSTEYYKTNQWIHGYTELPLNIYKDLPVRLEDGAEPCAKFVTSVRQHMDSAIYGHDDAKLQILQFVSSWIANPKAAGNVLSVHGPPGVGKTTLIKDGVAKALGRPFHFITLGGATDASYLDGHSYTYEGSTWGRIVDVLIKSKCMNPIIYFDELDKVSDTPKGEEINNLLIHLTDGSQNDRFQDKYFAGIDLDLSRCLFIFSHNNHEKVNPILRDRMYNIQVGGFGLKEKLIIAEQYLVSAALREVNLFEKIGITKDILTYVIEEYTGEEQGVRELKRCIQSVISKLNLLRFYNDPAKVPFSIKDFALPFSLKRDHIDLFLKKKSVLNPSIAHLYC
jgi:hypothetical protein